MDEDKVKDIDLTLSDIRSLQMRIKALERVIWDHRSYAVGLMVSTEGMNIEEQGGRETCL